MSWKLCLCQWSGMVNTKGPLWEVVTNDALANDTVRIWPVFQIPDLALAQTLSSSLLLLKVASCRIVCRMFTVELKMVTTKSTFPLQLQVRTHVLFRFGTGFSSNMLKYAEMCLECCE